jgi:hypothetical protein
MAAKWNLCITTLVVTIMCLLGSSAGAQAYEEINVRDGGTLAGSVALLGDVPHPKTYNLVTFLDPVYCGRISNGAGWRLLQPFDVGPNGEFRQVAIMVVGVEKAFLDTRSKIEAVDCTFWLYTSVVFEKWPLDIVNMAPVLHDASTYENLPTRGAGPVQ